MLSSPAPGVTTAPHTHFVSNGAPHFGRGQGLRACALPVPMGYNADGEYSLTDLLVHMLRRNYSRTLAWGCPSLWRVQLDTSTPATSSLPRAARRACTWPRPLCTSLTSATVCTTPREAAPSFYDTVSELVLDRYVGGPVIILVAAHGVGKDNAGNDAEDKAFRARTPRWSTCAAAQSRLACSTPRCASRRAAS